MGISRKRRPNPLKEMTLKRVNMGYVPKDQAQQGKQIKKAPLGDADNIWALRP